jgi:hypothetical protein
LFNMSMNRMVLLDMVLVLDMALVPGMGMAD